MIDEADVERIKTALDKKTDELRADFREVKGEAREALQHVKDKGPLFEPDSRTGRVLFYGAIVLSHFVAFWIGTAIG